MTTPVESTPTKAPRARGRMDSVEVLRSLQDICATMKPGDTVPPHHEIMRTIDASERSVRWALDELRRQGTIVRRPGAKTVIAHVGEGENEKLPQGKLHLNGRVSAAASVDNSSVVAIGEPDGGVFDYAMRVLMKQAKSAKMVVNCRFMQPDEMEAFSIPSISAGARKFVIFRQHFLPLAERLQAEGHHVVLVGTPYNEAWVEVPNVSGNQEHGGYLATKHLLDLGHRRLAFYIWGNYKQLQRWVGWQRALNEARESGLEVQEEIIDIGDSAEWRSQHHLAQAYFARPDAPTGIVAWNDDSAVELLTLLQRCGIRVPEDVSIVGYDNLKRAAEVHPAITTVDGALDTQIQAALRLLNQSNVASSHQTVVMPTLLLRESSAPPRS